MKEKEVIYSNKAPEAIGPYSQAIVANGMVFCSGQIGILPGDGSFAGDSIKEQTRQVMKNLDAVLKEAGSDFSKVIKCSIFIANMDDFAAVNKIYGEYFEEDPPSRETVAVKTLPKNALVEISCIAMVG